MSLEGLFSFVIVKSVEKCMVHAVHMSFVALLFEMFFAAIAVL